jgi:hypothetical protein
MNGELKVQQKEKSKAFQLTTSFQVLLLVSPSSLCFRFEAIKKIPYNSASVPCFQFLKT